MLEECAGQVVAGVMEFEWVSTMGRLRSLAQDLAVKPLLAVDTEFVRVDTFYPLPGLLQMADREQAWLVDPLALPRPHELARVFYGDACTKVLHACFEDLEVLEQLTQLRCRAIFDTQLAAAYLGHGLQIGYQKLLQEELAITIRKEESRSDWLQRPLTPEQLRYAVQDVEHLLPLYDRLQQRLQALGHWERVLEDNLLLLSEVPEPVEPELVYRDVANAWRLKRQQLAVLQALCLWRETEAVRRNMPRSFLLRNNSLLPLAQQQPVHKSQLALVEGMTPRILRREGDALLEVIRTAQHSNAAAWPALLPWPWPRELRDIMMGLKQALEPQAAVLGLPLDVLIRKRHYEELLECFMRQREPRARWLGWRHDVVFEPAMHYLAPHRDELEQWQARRWR
ncbi:MAG: ribonuclease D [Pseudomonadales bacterium]|nr:ribonuclease D [Pseudomonadales bacterium]